MLTAAQGVVVEELMYIVYVCHIQNSVGLLSMPYLQQDLCCL
jgi:hypothetical protein